MDGQMKKGVLEMCVLHLLSQNDLYGYQIMKETINAFPGVQEATVYTILRRLHAENFAETYNGGESNGPPRKYYKLTVSGMQKLKDLKDEWNSVIKGVLQIGINIQTGKEVTSY